MALKKAGCFGLVNSLHVETMKAFPGIVVLSHYILRALCIL